MCLVRFIDFFYSVLWIGKFLLDFEDEICFIEIILICVISFFFAYLVMFFKIEGNLRYDFKVNLIKYDFDIYYNLFIII